MDIIRTIPEIKRLLPKPDRFDFDKYLKYKNNSKFQEQYKDLNNGEKNGIHPFTKRQFDKNNKCFYNTLMKNITTFPYEYYDMLYGCPHIIKINNKYIHKTNDCNGLMILHEHIKCTCNACLIFIYGCGNTGSDIYKCTNCDIIHFV